LGWGHEGWNEDRGSENDGCFHGLYELAGLDELDGLMWGLVAGDA
jgi:hypothetical protein